MSNDEKYITWEGQDCPDWMDADNPPEGIECKPNNGAWRARILPRDPLSDFAHYRIPANMAPKPEPETPSDHCKFDGAGWYLLTNGKCVKLNNNRECPEGNGLIGKHGTNGFWLWQKDGTIGGVFPSNNEPIENWYLTEKLDGLPELPDGYKHKHPPEYRLPKKGELFKGDLRLLAVTALVDYSITKKWILEKVEEPETKEAPELQLEVGKSYRRADGSVDKIVYYQTAPVINYPFRGSSGLWYMPNGQLGDVSLIEEVPPIQPEPELPELQLQVGKSYRRADGTVKNIERENKLSEHRFTSSEFLSPNQESTPMNSQIKSMVKTLALTPFYYGWKLTKHQANYWLYEPLTRVLTKTFMAVRYIVAIGLISGSVGGSIWAYNNPDVIMDHIPRINIEWPQPEVDSELV